MGQRGANAAFMPNKFVFPGGARDEADSTVPLAGELAHPCAARLEEAAPPGIGPSLVTTAIRELWEETGLPLGRPGIWPGAVPPAWQEFAARGLLPDPSGLQFVFRAITPPGRPRRFDARFFLVDARQLQGDPDDFSAACDELSHLQWVALRDARRFDMPFITEVVLAEIEARLLDPAPPKSVPFFRNTDEESHFHRLRGQASGA